MTVKKEIVFGLADFTIGEGADAIKFDGKDYLQAEGGELTLTPIFREIQVADFGDTIIERRLAGWEGGINIVAAEEDVKILELALGTTEAITEAVSSEVIGSMDARIGTRLKGQKVTIHPRILPKEDKSQDIVLYQVGSTEGLTRSYGDEQGNISINLSLMPRVGFDASKPANFFYRGPIDPNATVPVTGP